MNIKTIRAAVMLLGVVASQAWAGRPLGTDDAATADLGTCLLEAWNERTGSDRALIAGFACGVAKGIELGVDYTHPHPRDEVRGESGLALKWVPESWSHETAAGKWDLGLKFSTAFEHPAHRSWRHAEASALVLSTLTPSDDWTIHANLGVAHSRDAHRTGGILGVAAVWTPAEPLLLFTEVLANTRSQVFGGTVKTTGARWWLIQDVLGLDLTASRESGSSATLWSVGFGWYGISF